MSMKSKLLLIIPLLFFVYLWLTVVFGITIAPKWLFYDSYPHAEDPISHGLLPSSLIPILIFVGAPIGFFLGVIYTFYKKLWWWLGTYIFLGFGFWLYLV